MQTTIVYLKMKFNFFFSAQNKQFIIYFIYLLNTQIYGEVKNDIWWPYTNLLKLLETNPAAVIAFETANY